MAFIELKYGVAPVRLEYDPAEAEVLAPQTSGEPLSDVQINEKLDTPIDSPPLEEKVTPGDTVLLVVPDATRDTAAGQMVNLIVRRLIANGTAPHEIRIIFATGIHRKVTEEEKFAILTPFIAQRIKTLDHDARDLVRNVSLRETSGGTPIELNRALLDNDHVVLIGGVSFHYFAGFTGGRKLVCPGLASSRTVSATHRLAFDCHTLSRREGVDTGVLEGNAVHEAFTECAAKAEPSFAVSTIVNERGEAIDVYCGDWRSSHEAACAAFAETNTLHIAEKRDLVIVSCGGYPHDVNMIQAHKALDAAGRACSEGGTIILLAECRDGLGRNDFLNWFESPDSNALAVRLCEKYQVNGQTAWSLLQKTERFDVRMMTSLTASDLKAMRIQKIDGLPAVDRPAYIIPHGSKVLIKTTL